MTNVQARERAIAIDKLPLEPVGQRSGLIKGSGRSLGDIWAHRELLTLLIRREIKARYKDSSLGIVWSLFKPLVQLLIYYFAIGQVLGAARSVQDFAVFVFTGLTTWGLFSEVISSTTRSVVGNSGLVKKVYLPREIFPLSAVGGALFNFAVQCVVLVAAIFLLASFPWGPNLLLAPFAILMLLVFSTAVGLILSAINVYLRDIEHLVEICVLVLFWASPIVYPFTYVHNALHGNWLEQLYAANPVTIAVTAMQRALWAGAQVTSGPTAQVWPGHLELRLAVSLLISIALLWIAQRIFSRLQGNFAQEL
jgi:ABC-2 type transport system permease protein